MLDNLRNQTSFEDEEDSQDSDEFKSSKPRKVRRNLDQITGMTAQQRFILAVMLAVIVCLLGTMLLLLSGRIILPF
jgi:hypothetical protein